MGCGLRDEEGTGDEEDLKGEVVVDIQYGEDADDNESGSVCLQEYPVMRLSILTKSAICFTAMDGSSRVYNIHDVFEHITVHAAVDAVTGLIRGECLSQVTTGTCLLQH